MNAQFDVVGTGSGGGGMSAAIPWIARVACGKGEIRWWGHHAVRWRNVDCRKQHRPRPEHQGFGRGGPRLHRKRYRADAAKDVMEAFLAAGPAMLDFLLAETHQPDQNTAKRWRARSVASILTRYPAISGARWPVRRANLPGRASR